MLALLKYELKTNFKPLLIWALSVSFIGAMCIFLYSGMKDDMSQIADSFSSMGAFSDALGMSQLSIGTITGYYATEIGTIHALGGTMFAALNCICILSKEEENHTGEFLFSFPISRGKIVSIKWITSMILIVLFNIICVTIYSFALFSQGEHISNNVFFKYHILQIIIQIEIGSICFLFSAIMKKSKWGIGIGLSLLLYSFDLISRINSDLNKIKFITPFSFGNASEIFIGVELYKTGLIFGIFLFIICSVSAYTIYVRRDLAP